MALVIVKDGKAIYSKGLGYKDFENEVPVTSSTQFAIGSATKAFTALSVLLLQDQGKLSVDDSPKKYLPYFKINNPKTDAKIQIRDLLSHSSGLARTDLAMITGKLDREELIKVAGIAKPTAELRETFQYQNIMFAAAGEIVSKVSGMPWERFVPDRILGPLGMSNTSMSAKEMEKAKDYSFGYSYNFDTKETRKLPIRDIEQVAPAGSINSSADDMAKWLEFILAGGEAGGKRLLSESSYDEWLKPQMKITPDGKVSYGFGWFVQEWKGKKMVQHGGNIDGFNSMVAALPEENLGFVMLTNVSASSLGGELIETVFSGILEDLPDGSNRLNDEAKKEAGTYKFPAAGFDIVVAVEENKLVMKVPGQPTYELQNVEGRKYKLGGAPDGFFMTFRDGEALLEQPQGNFTLPKEGAAESPKPGTEDDAVKELVGRYQNEQNKSSIIEIKEVAGKTSLVVEGQSPYPLEKKGEDEFRSPGLPETYGLRATRDGDGKLSGIVMIQPEGEFPFKYLGAAEEPSEPLMSAKEVGAKIVDALGGEANWRKLTTRVAQLDLNFINQGVTAKGFAYSKAPNATFSSIELFALGKKIGWIKEYFDGKQGEETYSFGPEEVYTGQRLEDATFAADFYGYLDLESKIKSSKVEKIEKVGDEDTYRLTIEPKKATPFTVWVSANTFLPLKRRFVVVSSTTSQRTPVTETYSDYRKVDGVMIPFKVVSSNPNMGDLITVVKSVKHNVKIDDKKFSAQ
jgi:CubicO group peptidase (beta-lactamase class C family)